MGYSPWSHKELDTTEQLTHIHISILGYLCHRAMIAKTHELSHSLNKYLLNSYYVLGTGLGMTKYLIKTF